jgi:Arc/MetJ-type ribon-helix-helix transcriptional regulator
MECTDDPRFGIETKMSMTITLPEHIQAWIDQQIAEGRFESEEAVIANAVEQAMGEYRWEDDQELGEAIADYEQNGGETVTDIKTFLERLSGEARENSRNGVPVPYDVTC